MHGGSSNQFRFFAPFAIPGRPKWCVRVNPWGQGACFVAPACRSYFAGCPAESLRLVGGVSLGPHFRPAIRHGLLVAAKGFVSKRVFGWGLAHKSQRARAILGSQPHAFVLGQKYLVNPGTRLLNLPLCGVQVQGEIYYVLKSGFSKFIGVSGPF